MEFKIIALLVIFLFSGICFSKDEWLVEFDTDDPNLTRELADRFSKEFDLENRGFVEPWVIYHFVRNGVENANSDDYDKRIQLESILKKLEDENLSNSPTHPIKELREEPIKRKYNKYGIRWIKRQTYFNYTLHSFNREFKKETLDRIIPKDERYNYLNIVDPYFKYQWHLHNIGIDAIDIKVEPVWAQGFTGEGIQIAICDVGVDANHGDIKLNYAKDDSINLVENYIDYFRGKKDSHGTSTAGVAAARDDKYTCGVGVAFRSKISSIVIVDIHANDLVISKGIQHNKDSNHIYSNSWGPVDNLYLNDIGPLTKQAIDIGVRFGRNNLGSIYVWSAGNGGEHGDRADYDAFASNRKVISVSATYSNGKIASYSEPGASILTSAPVGGPKETLSILTSNVGDKECTLFSGTSAACPMISGVVALMLQAAPNTTWLEVQDIIVKTSTKIHPNDPSWITNGAGHNFSHYYGFGLINAYAAVNMASKYSSIPRMVNEIKIWYLKRDLSVELGVGYDIDFRITIDRSVVIHHAELIVTISGNHARSFYLTLTSPSGTVSEFQNPTRLNQYINDWTFTTKAIWGENSKGNWTFTIVGGSGSATLKVLGLNLYGISNKKVSQGFNIDTPLSYSSSDRDIEKKKSATISVLTASLIVIPLILLSISTVFYVFFRQYRSTLQ